MPPASQNFNYVTSIWSICLPLFLWHTYKLGVGNRMNASAIKHFHHKWYLKILSKLHKPLGECNLKEFLNTTSSVNLNMHCGANCALCKWADCTRRTCVSKTSFIPGIWPVSGLVIVKKKLTSVFLCICPLIEDKFCHNIVEVCCGDLTQFIINERTKLTSLSGNHNKVIFSVLK